MTKTWMLSVFLALVFSSAHAQQITLPPSPAPEGSHSTFTLDQTHEGVMNCNRQTQAELRLRCYDELAMRVSERIRQAGLRGRFAWASRTSGNLERGDLSHTISMAASAVHLSYNRSNDTNSFFFTIVCRPASGHFDVYLAFPEKVTDQPAPTMLYINRSPAPASLTLRPSVSGAAIGIWANPGIRDFIQSIRAAETLVFDVDLGVGRRAILEFDILGFPEVMAPLERACRRN
jgi:hypothetical protein